MIKWFLDNTLEITLAYVRGVALVLPIAALVCFVAAIWAPEDGAWWRLLLTGGLLVFIAGGAATFGFWFYGNEEWRPKRGDADG